MSGFLSFIDNTLETLFSQPAYSAKAGRKKLIRVIDKAKEQQGEGRTRAPRRAWEAGNNEIIRFSPKIDGKPVLIGGQETNHVRAENFPDFLDGLKAAVEAGELDDAIQAAEEGTVSGGGIAAAQPKEAKDKFPKHLRADWDKLDSKVRRQLGIWWGKGKNPDQSDRAVAGDKPDAKIVQPTK